MRRRSTLDEALAYKNRDVVDRFCETWKVERGEANAIFDDLKRYLWLCGEVPGGLPPVAIVDEMWHTFVLFTTEYREWTMKAFGRFVDHVPTTVRQKAAASTRARRSPARVAREYEEFLVHALTTVHDKLGRNVMIRWYVTYAERYGADFFARRRRPLSMSRFRATASLRRIAGAAR